MSRRETTSRIRETPTWQATLEKVIEQTDGDKKQLLELFLDFANLPHELNEDLKEANWLLGRTTHEFAVRTLVRTMSAEFEGKLYLFQQMLLKMHMHDRGKLTADEVVILSGRTPSLGHGGKIVYSERYYPFKESLLFTLKLVAREYKMKIFSDTSHPNWPHVLRFVDIRNRYTHPKRVSDMVVRDEDIESINRAQDWIREAYSNVVGLRTDTKNASESSPRDHIDAIEKASAEPTPKKKTKKSSIG